MESMNSYFPSISSMKLPLMPGSIIAHIAIAPDRNMNHSASGVWVGDSVHTTTPSMMPSTSITKSFPFHPLMSLSMKTDEATIRPKKNAHVGIGS